MAKRLRADKLNAQEPGDRIIGTKRGPVFVRAGKHYSVNAITPFGGGETKYELRYQLSNDNDFEFFGLKKPR